MFGSNYNNHRASLGYSVRSVEEADRTFYNRAEWSMKFAILPHRCNITKKIIWLQSAYQGCAGYPGQVNVVYEYRWHDRHEHLIWILKGPYG